MDLRLLPALLLVCVAACAASESSDSSTDDDLVGGKPTSEHPEVGRVRVYASKMIAEENHDHSECTGVLVAPNLVVSHASCQFGIMSSTSKPASFFIDVDKNGDGKVDATLEYEVDTWDAAYSGKGANVWRKKFMVLRLKKPVPASVAQPAKLRFSPLAQGERLTVYGYGSAKEAQVWGPKLKAPISYQTGVYVLQASDYGSGAFDNQGRLAAMGVRKGERSAFWGDSEDGFVDIGTYGSTVVDLMGRLTPQQ